MESSAQNYLADFVEISRSLKRISDALGIERPKLRIASEDDANKLFDALISSMNPRPKRPDTAFDQMDIEGLNIYWAPTVMPRKAAADRKRPSSKPGPTQPS